MNDQKENIENTEMQLDGGTYEILKQRLRKDNVDLRERLNQLNVARKDVFGAIDFQLQATERVTTNYNCVPWDMFSLGNHFLFGYNIHMGLKTEIKLEDVFSFYCFRDHEFHQATLEILDDENFHRDFQNLYKYYRDTQFVKFAKIGQYLHMVFRFGTREEDIKTFKWLIKEETLQYVDNRSEHEFRFPHQHEFRWKQTTRENFCEGEHPHISIEDIVFVETVGGDLTIKVEDNTKDGKGIYNEPVKHQEQRLDDAEVEYAIIDHLVIFRIKPYQEAFRYFVYNSKLQEVKRVDSMEEACILLPESQGLLFSDGYYLQSGEYKRFEQDLEHMLFERCITSPNGEDFLYVFYNQSKGVYLLLPYNLIEQRVENPIVCHGFSLFDNGEMCLFKAEEEAKKHHAIQIWQTPFIGADFQIDGNKDSFLYKIGNKDIVRAMAECHSLMTLTDKEEVYNDLYLDIIKYSTDVLDTYHWLNKKETFELTVPLHAIKETASAAVEEYEKVRQIQQNTKNEYEKVTAEADELIRVIKREIPHHINDFVQSLTNLRKVRGEVISLKELRYVDIEAVENYDEILGQFTEETSKSCVQFLLKKEALAPYQQKVSELTAEIEQIKKVVEANALEEKITENAAELEMLIEIVSNLQIEDATETTRIIDNISEIYASFNQIKASLKRKRKSLLGEEGKAEFNAQIKLVDQGVVNYIDLCDTPEKCEEYLTKLMVQLEELEGKFSEFDSFVEKISLKREELYNAFESKKVALVEARNKRATTLQQTAERILKSVKSRLSRFKEVSEINGYIASDLMVEKIRKTIEELENIGDSVKADDIQSKLKSLKEEAIRQLKDKSELFVDGKNIIQFGNYKFSVNTQNLDLTMVFKNDKMYYHLTGTDYFEEVVDKTFNEYRPVWNQILPSENRNVYRSEYLAYQILEAVKRKELIDNTTKAIITWDDISTLDSKDLLKVIQKFSASKYSEGYVKGVHDQDTLLILHNLIQMYSHVGMLKHDATTRAFARFYWEIWEKEEAKKILEQQLKAAGILLKVFPNTKEFEAIKNQMQNRLEICFESENITWNTSVEQACDYLFDELAFNENFVIDANAADLVHSFDIELRGKKMKNAFEKSMEEIEDMSIRFQTIQTWLKAFMQNSKSSYIKNVEEAALLIILQSDVKKNVHKVITEETLENLTGTHEIIEDGKYQLNIHDFQNKLEKYSETVVPTYEKFTSLKHELLEETSETMRLGEFKPRVLSSFVRNQLIDKVYLQIIGANLAKQIGTAGENKRTDLMGLLLLISPPGYGKTTLMEYVANRLGLIFMKINGPALGHDITSVDPSEATNAGAKQELEKLNLAFEMGDNVMIYLDDIQHCNPEFLQKFISLCDGQRKIEGVYKGKPKTYDFRGKKVCVIMAGNPYTESGEKFQIPDMLANRADIYNLGDILGDSAYEFELSYIENSITSNPTLSKLANKSQKDILTILKIAETNQRENVEFEANHSAIEIKEYISVFKKLIEVRDVVLKVNQAYIQSAGISEEYRTEPMFKLQGSYRDMNKMAEKIVPVMNDKELKTLIISHYERESQTLTSGAEANILKFREMIGLLSEEEKDRWNSIKETFLKKQKLNLVGGNQMGQILEQMEAISESLQKMAQVDRISLN
ncbi:DNA repair ATPase [Aureivirga marina]|uniref:DNA repair ATPase n=1 Tax=Aureivirga marina TaxID=1182451 RepID=UPI0018C8EDF4|nr:DNA repair ATPase [Aureivirga marina]